MFKQREKAMSEMQTAGMANSTPAVLVPDTPMGFRAVAYRCPQTNEIAIVYEGTSCPLCIKDWATNLSQPFWKPLQYSSAYDFAQEVETRFCADAGDCEQRITQTGHSLGGGLAQYVAIKMGRKAYTFNAAGLWGPTGGEVDTDVAARAELTHFRSKGYMFGQRLGTDVVPYLGVQFSQQTIDIPVELPAWTWDAFTVELATHSMERLRDQMFAMAAAEPNDDRRIDIAAPDVAENGAVIPVTVGIGGETIREIALYSGDLSRWLSRPFSPRWHPLGSARG